MQYSRLEFSVSTDRPVAIAGLETRLINAFDTAGGFGLFERYLGRSLLWHRAPDVAQLTRIRFERAPSSVPSWSWMAYEGAISFLNLPFGEIDWTVNVEFRSPYSTYGSSHGSRARMSSSRSEHCAELRVIARPFDMTASTPEGESSGIVWDDSTVPHTVPHDQLRCVIIGKLATESSKLAQRHWVLVIREISTGRYERVGAGFLPKDKILQDAREMDSVIC
jgi:hypothetical protein